MSLNPESVPAELTAAMRAYPESVALRDRGLSLSYGQLAAFVTACRNAILGCKAVGIYGAPGALFGATATACVVGAVPFVHLDPAMPKAVLENILAELEIDLVLCSQPPLPGQLPERCTLRDAMVFLDAPAVEDVEPATVSPDHPIYLVATSGTTGRPKCIPVTHDAAFLSYRWRDAYTPYHPGMRVGCYIFAIWEMFRPLRHGGEVCFPGLDDLLSPQALARFMTEHDLHEMLFTPSFFEKMLSGLDPETASALPLRRIILNGEVVSDRLITEARAKLTSVILWNLYSICETHDICMSELTDPSSGAEGVSVGRAMPHLRAVVLDDEDRPCLPGIAGRLHFEGARMLGPGYINRPEETEQRFRRLTIEGRAVRLYDTGDQGFVDQHGEIVVLGRIAHMLKLRGHSIQTRDLSDTMSSLLAFSHAIPWVRAIGNGGQALVFYFTADKTQSAANKARWGLEADNPRTPEALTAALRSILPGYCVPSYLVQLDEIPINAVSGKCNYKALPDLSVRPQDHLEDLSGVRPTVIHAARIMRCSIAEIDAERSFHDHGGDSLMCIDLIMSLETAYRTRVDFDWALSLPLDRLHYLLSHEEPATPRPVIERTGILLTGATGFLGRYVLAEAARHLPDDQVVYCLVRPGEVSPQQRIDAIARDMNIPTDRIALVCGAVDLPRFGLDGDDYARLAQQVGSVIHCAATVNLAVAADQMLDWSRMGLATILDFCHDAAADLRFSSSTAVFPDLGGPYPENLATPFEGCTGYGAAKIAAEAQILAAGLSAAIVRLPSLFDLARPNPKDINETILRACRDCGAVPKGLSFPMTDVSSAAAFLFGIDPTNGARFYNLVTDDRITVTADNNLQILPTTTEWLDRASFPGNIHRLIAANPDMLGVRATYRSENAEAVWSGLGRGDFRAICDSAALLAARLGHHREPALT